MGERRDPHQAPLRAARIGVEERVVARCQRVVDPARQVHHAEHVGEAAVLGPGEDEIRRAELPHAAEPLQRSAVDQGALERVGADEAVDGIAERRGVEGHRRGSIAAAPRAPRRQAATRSRRPSRVTRVGDAGAQRASVSQSSSACASSAVAMSIVNGRGGAASWIRSAFRGSIQGVVAGLSMATSLSITGVANIVSI